MSSQVKYLVVPPVKVLQSILGVGDQFTLITDLRQARLFLSDTAKKFLLQRKLTYEMLFFFVMHALLIQRITLREVDGSFNHLFLRVVCYFHNYYLSQLFSEKNTPYSIFQPRTCTQLLRISPINSIWYSENVGKNGLVLLNASLIGRNTK